MFNFFGKKTQNSAPPENISDRSIAEDFNDIEPIAFYFKAETGITFEKQQSILKSKLISFCKIRHIPSFKKCLEQVKNNQRLKQELINYLTTNESFFYREQHQIQDVVNKVKLNDQVVNILCAPSSTGEEIYSIAIALLEAGVAKNRFNLIGIDINSEALKHAELGIYNQRNIKNIPAHVLTKYFNKKESKYCLSNEIKQCVRLQTENIFSPSFKTIGKFDYIFSRNMLIYFDAETKIKARQILESLLNDNKNPVYFGHADLF
jgi:chemotaxis protein methyltransferase CheR